MHSAADEGLQVVIVDDDVLFRDLICAAVSALSNFTMFTASSGNALFDLLSRQPIDCILLDYNLGEESGFEIQRRLDETFAAHPPTIMLTGDGRERTAIKAFQMGINDYLPKRDLRPGYIVATVAKVVERRRKEALRWQSGAGGARMDVDVKTDPLRDESARVKIDLLVG